MRIGLVVKAVLPEDEHVGMDLERVTDLWPSSMAKLANMGVVEGTLTITEDWRLLFELPSGHQLLWHENTRQWENV